MTGFMFWHMITLGLFLLLTLDLLSATGTSLVQNDDETLKLVILIHRHGDRSPIETYPRDPYRNESYWPDGWGQLTLKGKKRMFNLGKYLAKRYKGFLGASPREVHIRSSGSDRCLESVSMVLAGLYPPESRWIWNDDLGKLWQPFPIQTVPHDHDGMLNPDSICKEAKKETENIYNSNTVLNYYNKMKPTLRYVEDNTGYKEMDLIKAEEVYDSLLIEKLNNYKLPAWVDQYVYKKLEDIATKTFIFSAMTRRIQRFRAGLLLKDIVDHLMNNITKRLYIYSTHDTMLSVFLSAINAYNDLAPPFGSSILLELYQNRTQEPYLKAYYLNVTESESPYSLRLQDCLQLNRHQSGSIMEQSSHCSISNFYLSVRDLIPDDWKAECQNTAINNADVINVYILMATLMVTVFVLLFFIYLFLNNRRHTNLYKMLPIN